jgi:hypothetical protein
VAPPGTSQYTKLFISYWSYLIDELIKLLGAEYDVSGGDSSAAVLRFDERLLSASLQAAERKTPRIDPGDGPQRDNPENLYRVLRDELGRLVKELEKAIEAGEAGEAASVTNPSRLIQHDLRVASPGLYIDSLLGVSPATEPYSEEMRAQKVLNEASQVARQFAVADYYRSLIPERSDGDPKVPAVIIARRDGNRRLSFRPVPSMQSGEWHLHVDGAPVKTFEIGDGIAQTVLLEWDVEQSWLSAPAQHVIVIHQEIRGSYSTLAVSRRTQRIWPRIFLRIRAPARFSSSPLRKHSWGASSPNDPPPVACF